MVRMLIIIGGVVLAIGLIVAAGLRPQGPSMPRQTADMPLPVSPGGVVGNSAISHGGPTPAESRRADPSERTPPRPPRESFPQP